MEDQPPTPPGQTATDGPELGASVAAPAVSWGDAVHRHARWLRRVVFGRLGTGQGVDEVMQEVALAVVVARPGPAVEQQRIAAWLYRVAVRQSLLYRRKTGRRRRLIEAAARQAPALNHAARDADPLRWLLSTERDALIRRAVATLSPRDADVLVLKYTEHWSYRQIADHLGLSESAVEARLHRARRRLREELARLDVGEDSK